MHLYSHSGRIPVDGEDFILGVYYAEILISEATANNSDKMATPYNACFKKTYPDRDSSRRAISLDQNSMKKTLCTLLIDS